MRGRPLSLFNSSMREDVLPFKQEIADLFNQWKIEDGKEQDEKKFKVSPYVKWPKMLRRDLEEAGTPYQDSSGRFADFHALRHTYITNVVKGGASPKVAQSLARHSKITLTMDTYTHMSLYDQRGALENLPSLPCLNNSDTRENAAAELKTGTDNQPIGDYKKI